MIASTDATIAPIVTGVGRSPGSSGSSCARAAAFLASVLAARCSAMAAPERRCAGARRFFFLFLPDCANALLRLEGGAHCPRRRLRVGGVADRAHHYHP